MTIAVDWDVNHQTKPKNLEKNLFSGINCHKAMIKPACWATVNLEIFARFLFSRNFPYAKFCENKFLAKWRIHSVLYWYNWRKTLIESAEGWRKAVEIISWSISTKVWDRAGIDLVTPGSAVRYATDCTTPPISQDKAHMIQHCRFKRENFWFTIITATAVGLKQV